MILEVALIAGLWLVLNVLVTRRVLAVARHLYTPHRMLIATIWLFPFIGALMAFTSTPSLRVARGVVDRETPRDRDAEHVPAPETLAADGAPDFAVTEHLQWFHELPLLDWDALAAWAPPAMPGDERSLATHADAIERGRHAWLLHLREQLGAHMGLFVNKDAYVLSSLDDAMARQTADYVTTARARIERLLRGVAQFPGGHRSILLVLDDEDTYYRYVSIYYPDGEFSVSSGMFINAGCPHFVVVRGHLQQLEPVIAHEMTHAALAHLRLPRWLDEGVAVNTERRVAGAQGSLYTPHELHEMHRRHWSAARIQQLWSGESFFRTDDGTMLSYELARIIVEQMARDWEGFLGFLRAAHGADDAGFAAARDTLGVDLGAFAAALVEAPSDEGWSPQPAAWRSLETV